MRKKITYSAIFILIAILGLSLFFTDMSIDNKEISFRERFNAQLKITKTSHDVMWKVIKQNAEISNKYFEDFQKIFPELISSRYENDEQMLFKWVQEHNPEYSPELYSKLMNVISTERAKFKRAQDICIDITREYKTYVKKKPNVWFINDNILKAFEIKNMSKDEAFKAIEDDITKEVFSLLIYKPVTSTKTEDVFEKKIDDDVQLFKN